jgi:hypothetical protein
MRLVMKIFEPVIVIFEEENERRWNGKEEIG